MVKTIRPCCVPGCIDKTSRRFTIPTNQRVKEVWIQRIKNPHMKASCEKTFLQNRPVCKRHFADICFEELGNLRKNSLPTLNLPDYNEPSTTENCFCNPEPEFRYVTPEKVKKLFEKLHPLGPSTSTKVCSPLNVQKPQKTYTRTVVKSTQFQQDLEEEFLPKTPLPPPPTVKEPIDSSTHNYQSGQTDINLGPCDVAKTKVVESQKVSDVLSLSPRKSSSQRKRSNVESTTMLELWSLYSQQKAGLFSTPSNFPKRKFGEVSSMVAAKQTVPEVPLPIVIKEEPIQNEDRLEHIQMDLSNKNNTEIESEPNFDEIVDKEFAEQCLEYTLKFLKQCSYSDVRQEILMLEKLKNRWPQLK